MKWITTFSIFSLFPVFISSSKLYKNCKIVQFGSMFVYEMYVINVETFENNFQTAVDFIHFNM